MPVGTTITKANIDNALSNFGKNFNNLLGQIAHFTKAMDAIADGTLTATPYSYSGPELTLLRNAYRDLDKFRQVYSGLMYVTAGATLNSGVPTANDATHFGYPFNINVDQCDDFGY